MQSQVKFKGWWCLTKVDVNVISEVGVEQLNKLLTMKGLK